jgi:NADH-quinone oxidoreductase subunit G
MIKANINGTEVEVNEGTTVLEAARQLAVNIPTLCKHPDLAPTAACGICVVRNKASGRMLRACCTPIEDGMDLVTHDPEIVQVRRTVLELMMSKHPNECLTCGRNQNCELQRLCAEFNIQTEALPSLVPNIPLDESTGTIVLDPRKCIACGRCVMVCQETQNVWALSFAERGIDTRITSAGDIPLKDSPCVSCGQCSAHCPTGAIVEYDQTEDVWAKLQEPDAICAVQIAPAVRVAIGEAFGYAPGTNLTGKVYAALRAMGFSYVFDTNFGADVTIMEEASEFAERFASGQNLPLITTCCPAWVDFMEKYHQDMMPHFSSCKSPQAMVGALAKTYFAQKQGIDPAKLYVVSVMPCTAKKWEVQRSEEMKSSGFQDVDVALTTREIARMIKQAGIAFRSIPESQPDLLLGGYTGAGTIFGVTGGVMEAALRTASHLLTGKAVAKPDFKAVRGLDGVKEATVTIADKPVRIAVAHGLGNVEKVLSAMREAKAKGERSPYDFIEVMACAGGCVGGGGQPYGVTDELRKKRASGLYTEDATGIWRCSHENPYVQQLYSEFLGKPLSEKSHHLLHTSYKKRPTYQR